MGYKLTFNEVSELFNKLIEEYRIFAPKDLKNKGDILIRIL